MKFKVLALLVLVVILGTIAFSNEFSLAQGTNDSSGELVQTSSGLIASDALNQNLSQSQLSSSKYWFFSGDAPQENAPYSFYENSSGLGVGVQAPRTGTYAGYFAESPNTNFALVHVKLSAPKETIPSGFFESGVYLQTSNGHINYVTCTSGTDSSGTYWYVVSALGNTNQATKYDILWQSGPNMPLTEDCTIVTNGQNYLKVFLGGVLVFNSTTLNLQIPAPFQVYLEPESSYSGAELFSTFQNYYITSGENLKVNGLPGDAAQVQLVNSTNAVVASAPVSNGSARVEVANFVFPLKAVIQALDSKGNVIASTQLVGIYGGDTYTYQSVSSTSQTSSTSTTSTTTTTTSTTTSTSSKTYKLTVNTQDMSGNPIYGYYTVESLLSGQVIATAYSPATFTLNSGQTYLISVDGYANYVFDHWLDTGSTDSSRTISLSSNTNITAVYRNLDSPPPNEESIVNVETVSTSGQAIDGLYTFVSQSGNTVQTMYSPSQFLLPPGTYNVTVDNYGPYTFQKWSDGATSRSQTIVVLGGSTVTITAVYYVGTTVP